MDEELRAALADFDAVWRRCGAAAAPLPAAAQGDNEALEARIDDEAAGEAHYRVMARLTSGRSAETLLGLAADCRRNQKLLQTEYFLRVGDSRIPAAEPLPPDNLPGCLRRACLWEERCARGYMEASAGAESDALRQLFGELAHRCHLRRQGLLELVRRLMG